MAAVATPILLLISLSFFLSARAQHSTTPASSPNISYDDDYDLGLSIHPPTPTPAPSTTYQSYDDDYDLGLSVHPPTSSADASSIPSRSLSSSTKVQSVVVPTVNDKARVNKFVQTTMVASVSKTESFIQNVIEKRLNDPKTDRKTKGCMLTCKEVYEDSVSSMKKTMGDVKEGDLCKANFDVSAMSSNTDACKECATQVIGNDPKFQKFGKWVDGLNNDCLDKITGVHK